MTNNDTGRPIGSNPIADAASATAPDTSQSPSPATISPDDFSNNPAETPANEQSPDTPDQMDEENEADMLQQSGSETGSVDEHGHQSRDQHFTPVE